jgi:hypothetical protein
MIFFIDLGGIRDKRQEPNQVMTYYPSQPGSQKNSDHTACQKKSKEPFVSRQPQLGAPEIGSTGEKSHGKNDLWP